MGKIAKIYKIRPELKENRLNCPQDKAKDLRNDFYRPPAKPQVMTPILEIPF